MFRISRIDYVGLPFYAAYQDYNEQFMAILDIIAFPVGIIRGIMYFLGI